MAYFIPFGSSDKDAYDKGVGLSELFPTNVTGIVSGNDGVAIAPTKAELTRRMDIAKKIFDKRKICRKITSLLFLTQIKKRKCERTICKRLSKNVYAIAVGYVGFIRISYWGIIIAG